jgi:hypothetical protein
MEAQATILVVLLGQDDIHIDPTQGTDIQGRNQCTVGQEIRCHDKHLWRAAARAPWKAMDILSRSWSGPSDMTRATTDPVADGHEGNHFSPSSSSPLVNSQSATKAACNCCTTGPDPEMGVLGRKGWVPSQQMPCTDIHTSGKTRSSHRPP